MRRRVICLAVVALLTACGSQTGPSSPPASFSAAGAAPTVNPADIKRVRPALPPGYEVADMSGPVSAAGLWGFGRGWSADPQPCEALADPAPADAGARGLSASGQGGTIYVVVAAAPGPAFPDVGLVDQCGQWTMNFGHTSGAVSLVEPPAIDGARTVAMTVATRTAVESGTETVGHASTAQAYLGDHVAYVTLVTDPGSVHPPLEARFVADLLIKTVAALRG